MSLATWIYSWSLISYKNKEFIDALSIKLKMPGVVELYSEHELGNLLLGLVKRGVQDNVLLSKLSARIQQKDAWKKFTFVLSASCVEELIGC